ncbi:MAG: hypothetical protein O3A00_27295, partial [Planctomycetota bacterium]|nr:hypothetical protein [Planctomycetota bacterium]
ESAPAREAVKFNGMVNHEGVPLYSRYPPIHTVLISACIVLGELTGIHHHWLLYVVACLGHAASATLLFWYGCRTYGRKAALLAGVAWLAYVPITWANITLASDILFVPLVLAGCCLCALASERDSSPHDRVGESLWAFAGTGNVDPRNRGWSAIRVRGVTVYRRQGGSVLSIGFNPSRLVHIGLRRGCIDDPSVGILALERDE